MHRHNSIILTIGCIILIFSATALRAENIPSCIEIASKKDKPGASANCAPIILSNDKAFEIIKTFNIKKVGYDRYVFMKKEELLKADHKSKWELLALMVSAVQSLYEENVDCYIAVLPETDAEKTALILGSYPESKVAAHAKYVWPDLKPHPGRKWPANHHQRLYKLIVY